MASAIAISAPSSFPRLPTTKGASPSLRLDQPQTRLAAGPRSDRQDHSDALSANFHRSQDDRRCPQRSALHRCPTQPCDRSTNSRGRIRRHEKSLQTENILKGSNTRAGNACHKGWEGEVVCGDGKNYIVHGIARVLGLDYFRSAFSFFHRALPRRKAL